MGGEGVWGWTGGLVGLGVDHTVSGCSVLVTAVRVPSARTTLVRGVGATATVVLLVLGAVAIPVSADPIVRPSGRDRAGRAAPMPAAAASG